MIRCLVVEDEPLALMKIENYLKNYKQIKICALCRTVEEARNYLNHSSVDLLFLDIQLPDETGLALARSIQNKDIAIIFTTAYGEFALEGYKVNAKGYLLKPFSLNDFNETLNRVLRLLKDYKEVENENYIYIKINYRTHMLPTSSIRYIQANGERIAIYLVHQTEPIYTHSSMKDFKEQLPPNSFLRIHRCYYVNIKMIKNYTQKNVTLDNEMTLPVGYVYKKELEKIQDILI